MARPLNTLRRYFAREIYAATALALVAFLGLFAFFDLISELRDVGRDGYRMVQAFAFVLLSMPGHIYELFPIAVLLGTLYALSDMAAKSEYTVMRAAGLSPRAAVASLAQVGIVFVILCALVGELVTPFAERTAQQLRLKATGSLVAQEFRSGLWVKSESRFVNVGEVRPDLTLANIRMYEFDPDYRLVSISDAKTGSYEEGAAWTLKDVVQTRFDADGTSVRRLPEITWESALTPDVLSVLVINPDKMSAWNLVLYIRHLARNNQRTERYEIALWKKIVYPFAVLVMMALALPFAYVQVRHGGVGMKVFSGIMIGVVFHGMNTLFSHLGVLQNWPPFISAALPSAIFMVAALVVLSRVEHR